MIKARSKSKIKHSVAFMKKSAEEKPKKCFKQQPKQNQQKENVHKLSMTTVQSKKKIKPNAEVQSSRQVSPLCQNRKKNEVGKFEDERFIQKLFDKNYNSSNNKKSKNFLVEKLISDLVPHQNTMPLIKGHSCSYTESGDLIKQLHLKNQRVASLQHQMQQLKLSISNFTLKVFDLTVLCRKINNKMSMDEERIQFNRKTDEVIGFLDSFIRQLRLQEKVKHHCESISKRVSLTSRSKEAQSKKRCHTESLKIPIQEYLESLQNTQHQKFDMNFESFRKREQYVQQQSEQIMKILSKRSSGAKKEEQEIYVVIRPYEAKNEHQLSLRSGQRVLVLQKNDYNKWLGFKDGKVGYFPQQCLF